MDQFDFSRIGKARRDAIAALDEYKCTTEELRAMFGVAKTTFHRYADGVQLRRRPSKVMMPMTVFDDEPPPPKPMTPADALEIATIALLRRGYSAAEIVAALHTSKSAVYRQREAWVARKGDFGPAERKMRCRHWPTWPGYGYERPEERALEAERRLRRWVTRSRGRMAG